MIKSIITPIPPVQCVRQRQTRILGGKSLKDHRFTARLPRVKAPRELNPEEFLGHDTASAMVNGAVWGVVGAITYYLQRHPAHTRVVMTGGWARELSKLCNFEVTVESNLVSISNTPPM